MQSESHFLQCVRILMQPWYFVQRQICFVACDSARNSQGSLKHTAAHLGPSHQLPLSKYKGYLLSSTQWSYLYVQNRMWNDLLRRRGGCGSGGGVVHPVIIRSLVRLTGSPGCMLKCPWARCWTTNRSWLPGWQLAWQSLPSVSLNEWMWMSVDWREQNRNERTFNIYTKMWRTLQDWIEV